MSFAEKIRQQGVLLLTVFSLTLLASATLMFMLQPMVGRLLMPLIGGTPAGWLVALSFFQLMLLAGYFLAHALSRFSPRKHAALFIGALAVGAAFLPVSLARFADIVTDDPGPARIFLLLLLTVGAPFVALSATSSTVQRLFTATGHKQAHDPYFLYAASNLGSFGGLLLYPFVIERVMGVSAQASYWFAGYLFLIVMILACLFLARKDGGDAPAAADRQKSTVTREQRIKWILLALVPSSLMMGVTTHISTDIFAAPMVWIFPLGLYLLTFVIAFSRVTIFSPAILGVAHITAVVASIAIDTIYFGPNFRVSWTAAGLHIFFFTIVAWSCHRLLADSRPIENNSKNLTEFYMMLAIGGALGGILNAFIVPIVTNVPIEYKLMMLASTFFLPALRQPLPSLKSWRMGVVGLAIVFFTFYVFSVTNVFTFTGEVFNTRNLTSAAFIATFLAALLSRQLRVVVALAFAVVLLVQVILPMKQNIMIARNFFGVVRVYQTPIYVDGSQMNMNILVHGTTTHGMQIDHPAYAHLMTTYYTSAGPVGDVFSFFPPREAAIVGVGAGTMNCYVTRDSAFTFIDIDADVVDMAQNVFKYFDICQGREPPQFIIADGRKAFENMDGRTFDMIVLDAFSSDTIPLHLMTQEALEVYLSRLNPGGVILFNMSNRYFNLASAMAKTAADMGLYSRAKSDAGDAARPYGTGSIWMVVARGDVDFSGLESLGWGIVMPRPEKAFTDDFTDVISVMYLKDQLADKWQNLFK